MKKVRVKIQDMAKNILLAVKLFDSPITSFVSGQKVFFVGLHFDFQTDYNHGIHDRLMPFLLAEDDRWKRLGQVWGLVIDHMEDLHEPKQDRTDCKFTENSTQFSNFI